MRFTLAALLLLSGSCCFAGPSPAGAYGQLPLAFERNQGQAEPAVRYLARGRRYMIGVVDDGVRLRLKDVPDRLVQIEFSGMNRNSRFDSSDKLRGVSNYLIGNDPRLWLQGIPQYRRIWQRGVYPGIDVAYYGNQGQLEYDFRVQPAADPSRVRLRITGADQLRLDASGDLILNVNGAELRQKLPVAWQDRDGKRIPVLAHYRLMAGNQVGLAVEAYDSTRPLIIDPVLTLAYSTYLGGSMADQANGIAVDSFGNAWIAGSTTSVDFPVTGSPTPTNAGGTDAFIAKIDPTGTMLLFSTYMGGSGTDQANGIAVDPAGNVYITGSTNSTNFPTTAPMQMANAGGLDAFAVKLNPTGSVVYSTYIGGTSDDAGMGIAVDSNGIAYIAGYTSSSNFPTASPQQASNHGAKDAFILKLNAAGSTLLYSTFLGGTLDDQANGIAVDSFGSAYVAGSTQSSNFPLSAAYQTTFGAAFVVKLTSSGVVVYSTYLSADAANAIAVDSSGEAYVAGATSYASFPVLNAFQATWSDANSDFSNSDAFLLKLNAAGSGLIFSTYFGGATTSSFSILNEHPGGQDIAFGVAVDANGNAYITGSTTELGSLGPRPTPMLFPLQDALQGYIGPQPMGIGALSPWYHRDAFLASFSPIGSLLYSTDLGGYYDDAGTAVAVDSSGAAYVTGYSRSSDFPLQTPLQSTNAATCPTVTPGCLTSNAFISKLTFTTPGERVFFGATIPGNTSASVSVPITITGSGCSPGSYSAANTINTTLGTPVVFQTGANCSVSVSSSTGVNGTRYAFSSWADGPTTNPRVITTPIHGASYTVNVAPQYLLYTSVSSALGGSIVLSPASPDGYYASGTVVTVTAVPIVGYAFSNFTGDLIGVTNSQTLTMSAPHTVTAVFVPSGPPTVDIDAPVAGAAISGMVAVTGWVIDNTSVSGTAISLVQVKVDGVVVGNATYGSVRSDVCSVYPGRPNCPNVGYTFSLNANSLVPGNHTITVAAIDSDGTPDTGSASVMVSTSLIMTGTRVGVFRNGISFLEDSNGNGLYDAGVDRFIASFTPPGGAQAGDVPVTGDWTGDGHAKAGIYRPSTGTWWLDANNDGIFNAGDYTYQFGGLAGDVPVVGDWAAVAGVSGHKDCVGVYRTQGSVWLLDLNCNGTFDNTPADAFFPFGGLAGDVPVVGRWTGGTTQVGVVRKYAPGGVPQGQPFFWVPDAGTASAGNSPANHPPLVADCFAFGGLAGDIFVTGDWNNSGTSMAGVYRGGFWVLDAALPGALQASHVPGFMFPYGGLAGDVPVTGKW